MASLAAAGDGCAAPLKPTEPAPAMPSDADATVSRRFPNLDAYLAWLRQQSRLDRAWYREVRPGLYEFQPGNLRLPGERQRFFTREELEKKFGFAK